MYICKNCNHTSETMLNFCPICGNAMVLEQPAEVQTPDTYQNPVVFQNNVIVNQPEPAKKPNLAKKIIGMALSIEGFVMAIITVLYSFIFIMAAIGTGEPEMGMVALVFTFIMAIIGLPGSIIGLVFSNKARNAGDTSAMSRVGKGLGLAGIIVFAASFVIAILATIAGI